MSYIIRETRVFNMEVNFDKSEYELVSVSIKLSKRLVDEKNPLSRKERFRRT